MKNSYCILRPNTESHANPQTLLDALKNWMGVASAFENLACERDHIKLHPVWNLTYDANGELATTLQVCRHMNSFAQLRPGGNEDESLVPAETLEEFVIIGSTKVLVQKSDGQDGFDEFTDPSVAAKKIYHTMQARLLRLAAFIGTKHH